MNAALAVVCVFVVCCMLRAWYEQRVAPAVRRDLGTLEEMQAEEAAQFVAVFGESHGIRAPYVGPDRRQTVYIRPGKIKRPRDCWDMPEEVDA